MKLMLRDVSSEISISNLVFGLNFNESLVHQVLTSYRASSRSGTHSQKSRSDVSGSGKKPWRQKGTGRARSGSIRSPLWRSGGVTFAANSQSYKVKINKKMYRGALKNIFSELIRKNRLILVREFSLEQPKTRFLIDKLRQIGLKDDVLVLVDKLDKNLFLSARNLHKVKVCHVSKMNPYILIAFDKIVVTEKSVKNIEEMLI